MANGEIHICVNVRVIQVVGALRNLRKCSEANAEDKFGKQN